jgi:hypothetical protein
VQNELTKFLNCSTALLADELEVFDKPGSIHIDAVDVQAD